MKYEAERDAKCTSRLCPSRRQDGYNEKCFVPGLDVTDTRAPVGRFPHEQPRQHRRLQGCRDR